MSKGLLYFAQNSAFQHLTKIGKTTKLDVEDRGLSASNVPENFGYLAVFKCDDVDWAEKKSMSNLRNFVILHNHCQGERQSFFGVVA